MPATKLAALVDEAVGVELELRRLHSLDGDLTPKGFLEACAAVPGANAAEASKIEKALEGGPEAELLAPSFRRMLKGVRQFRRSGPHLKLGGYMDSDGDASIARLGCTRQSLFFAAARAATKHPSYSAR